MDAVSIKASAISQLGGTSFQVKPDLTVVYFDGNATEPSDSDITSKIAEIELIEARKKAYPPLAEQFDKLWHDINNGTLDNTGAFFTALKTVKDDNPKPGE